MASSSHALLLNQLSPFPTSSSSLSFHQKPSIPLHHSFHKKSSRTIPPSLSYSINTLRKNLAHTRGFGGDDDEDDEDSVIGDCIVFEEGVFEDPYLENGFAAVTKKEPQTRAAAAAVIEPQNLVPERWKTEQDAINITKKERRFIAQQAEFGVRVERRRQQLVPLRGRGSVEEYVVMRNAKLAQLEPVVLDNPKFDDGDENKVEEEKVGDEESGGRVKPKNPKWAVYGRSMDDISQFFNSGDYTPGDAAANQGPRKLFTKEEKLQLNKKIPDLQVATSDKWLPIHSLAASGDFFLMTALLKHAVDINGVDKGGLTALHKAIICKKQAVTNCLLRESANPFVLDQDGATLMHYAVRTASSHTIKILLLYNVDINLQDNDGWTPLHLAVQSRRTDVVRLLLIKGADTTIKNKDGLTPLALCLYSGRDTRTYELIKLLLQIPKQPYKR